MLALNFSYNVFIISDRITRPLRQFTNNTYLIATTITANDPADFSRNSYGQRTVNDVMKSLHHDRLDLLRVEGSGSAMWEVLHHMINDNLLLHVKQLHVTMRIGRCELYSLRMIRLKSQCPVNFKPQAHTTVQCVLFDIFYNINWIQIICSMSITSGRLLTWQHALMNSHTRYHKT